MHFCLGKWSQRALGLLLAGPLEGAEPPGWSPRAVLSINSPEPAARCGCGWGSPVLSGLHPAVTQAARTPQLSTRWLWYLSYGSLQSKPTPVVTRSLKPSLVKMQQNQKGGEKVKSLSLQLCDPMDCSPPASSIHGIFQARVLEWVARTSPGDLPNPRIEPGSPALRADSSPSEPPGKKGGNPCDF